MQRRDCTLILNRLVPLLSGDWPGTSLNKGKKLFLPDIYVKLNKLILLIKNKNENLYHLTNRIYGRHIYSVYLSI